MEYLHGDRNNYLNGCRCDKCKEANRIYMRKYYKKHPGLNAQLIKRRRAKKIEQGLCSECGSAKIDTNSSTRFCKSCLDKKRDRSTVNNRKISKLKEEKKKIQGEIKVKTDSALLKKEEIKSGKYDFLWNE